MEYDLPTVELTAQDSLNVVKRTSKRGKTLGFLAWSLSALTGTLCILTVLNWLGFLTPLAEAIAGLI